MKSMVCNKLNFQNGASQRVIYRALQMKHFYLIADADVYVNKSFNSALRNQYRSLLRFHEMFKKEREYFRSQRPSPVAYLTLRCSEAQWCITVRGVVIPCTDQKRPRYGLVDARQPFTSPIQPKPRATESLFVSH